MFKNLLNRILQTPAPAPAAMPVAMPDDIAGADAAVTEGNALEDAGQLAQAEALYRVAVAKAPGHARAHLNLGIALAAGDDPEGAAAAFAKVLAIDPAHPFGNYNAARLAFVRGDLQRARLLVAAALQAKPDFPQALVVQSNVLDALGEAEQAIAAMEAALRLQPGDAGAWFNLAIMLQKLARNDEAETAVTRVLAADPANTGALALHARLLREQGLATEALAPLRALIKLDPADWTSRSSELLLMIHAGGIPATEMFRRHVEFGVDLEQEVPARFDQWRERGDPARRLRVGYLSGDFYLHPVPIFLIPVLEQHDRSQVEVFCYSCGSIDDAMTQRLRDLSDHWREAQGLSDTALADAIHADGIDVLVDLVGHTGMPRLGVVARKPAPVQASWLGYLDTTGLTRMDFRLCDRRTDPLPLAQPLHTERLVHLPVSQWCYRPMVDEPVAGAPVENNGYVTFGSFNSALKIVPALCRRWGELLARLPDSRLIVANIDSGRKRAAILHEITSTGVAADRIEFLPRVPLDRYPRLYNAVDIALDTFPYGGGTTTFDSLWMGVPVLTATGETSVSRSASSILAELGLDDWIAPSIDDYVDLAVARALDAAAIASLRRSLRGRLQASPLTDMRLFARGLEAAYREMWNARGA